MVRNVANLVPKFDGAGGFHGTSAALEFGVKHLKVKNIVVMGHGSCGGVKGFLQDPHGIGKKTNFLSCWVSLLDPSYQQLRQQRSICDEESCAKHLASENAKVMLEGKCVELERKI